MTVDARVANSIRQAHLSLVYLAETIMNAENRSCRMTAMGQHRKIPTADMGYRLAPQAAIHPMSRTGPD